MATAIIDPVPKTPKVPGDVRLRRYIGDMETPPEYKAWGYTGTAEIMEVTDDTIRHYWRDDMLRGYSQSMPEPDVAITRMITRATGQVVTELLPGWTESTLREWMPTRVGTGNHTRGEDRRGYRGGRGGWGRTPAQRAEAKRKVRKARAQPATVLLNRLVTGNQQRAGATGPAVVPEHLQTWGYTGVAKFSGHTDHVIRHWWQQDLSHGYSEHLPEPDVMLGRVLTRRDRSREVEMLPGWTENTLRNWGWDPGKHALAGLEGEDDE